MRVQKNSEDIGRCGCGRRDYCDGSHGLTEAQWQQVLAKDLAAAQKNANIGTRKEASDLCTVSNVESRIS
jgi:CDGSH-type Zn-finger protein